MVLSDQKSLQLTSGGALDSESKIWVFTAGNYNLRTPLKPIFTGKSSANDGECSTTPTSEEARIPSVLKCPLAPKKAKAASRCNYNGVKEFFNPPDLETVFVRRRTEKAWLLDYIFCVVPQHQHHPLPLPYSGSSPDLPSPPPISSSYYPSAPHMLLALSAGLSSPPADSNPAAPTPIELGDLKM